MNELIKKIITSLIAKIVTTSIVWITSYGSTYLLSNNPVKVYMVPSFLSLLTFVSLVYIGRMSYWQEWDKKGRVSFPINDSSTVETYEHANVEWKLFEKTNCDPYYENVIDCFQLSFKASCPICHCDLSERNGYLFSRQIWKCENDGCKFSKGSNRRMDHEREILNRKLKVVIQQNSGRIPNGIEFNEYFKK